VKVAYFKEQGLEVFLEKLRMQGWLELFTKTQLGCSISELAESYARCSVTKGTVTSEVNGIKVEFDANKLGEILGVPITGFDIYVREDKFLLGKVRLPELARKLGQQPGLQTRQAVKKGDMALLPQLLF